ncbi:hypothetical protein L9F63_005332 [Diploptera punctata]|uniref:Uncharacterized protein n=1 Tax=Diploptera punctata TaxID=6984 RepID=A0AAD7ZE24_DIPPU|nr:hypothetical protein L9F63_005332 [Diploptera punctata]
MASSDPSEGRSKSLVSVLKDYGYKPLTKRNFMYYYSPLVGAGSYTLLSVNVMNPSLVIRFFSKRDVTNVLLFNALVGMGLYIYNRPHLNAAPTNLRIVYSTFGSVIFSFGSVLLWAVLRSTLPENMALATVAGISSGIMLIRVGQNYLDYVDSQLEIDE